MRIRLGATFGVILLLVAIMMTLALDAMPDSGPRGWIWGLGAAVLAFSVICWFRVMVVMGPRPPHSRCVNSQSTAPAAASTSN